MEYWKKIIPVLGLLCASHMLDAQSFVKKEIRDLQKMKNNWGNAVADYDLDGNLDVFMVAFDSYDPATPETWSRLLKNYGSGRFEDVTEEAGFKTQYTSSVTRDNKIGASWGDYDNDGYPDLFLTHIGKTELYRNQGNGTFKEVSHAAQIDQCLECINNSALWWDFDNDGYLDIYISDEKNPNQLYRNRGDGTFENVSVSTGLDDEGATWSSLPIDANKDGWMDLLVLNDFGQSNFYINISGESFVDRTQEYNLENPGDAMGATVGDCDNDGEFDIYITNISEFQPNPLFMGTESGEFVNQAAENGVEIGHWAWGTKFFDADHDGDEDLFVVNGWPGFESANKFYKNTYAEGQEGFVDWSEESSTNSFAFGMSAEVFDFDNDGDLDILVSNTNDAPDLYENTSQGGRSWLQIELEGQQSNRNAFGAVVSAWAGGRFFQRFHHGSGIMAQSIKPVHIGLGSALVVDSLAVDWPKGDRELFYDIQPNQKIKLVENIGLVALPSLVTSLSKEDLNFNESVVKVYPNPFQESVTVSIEMPSPGHLRYDIHSMDGKYIAGNEVFYQASQNLIIPLGDKKFGSGIYLMKFQVDGNYFVKRLVKIK